jgi:3'-phosphoadenosine 5'-phosphosulfate sulfotransferase (PAPS reductase)/FAD synthetase
MILFTNRPDFNHAWRATDYRVVMGGMGDDTAMLIAELYKKRCEPNEIVFCDTGSEFQRTYTFIKFLKIWCENRKWSKVTVLKKVDKFGAPLALIDMVEVNKTLPAAAFGAKSCSFRFKTETADLYFNNNKECFKAWGITRKGSRLNSHTGSILRLIGLNADEPGRVDKWAPEHKWVQSFPLYDWGVGEKESSAVEEVGLYYPGKSSCIMCPHLTGPELLSLENEEPDNFKRVAQIEKTYQENKTREDGPRGLCRRETIAEKVKSSGSPSSFSESKCSVCVG